MEDILSNPITWIILTALSEIIALSPLKDNSIVQLVLRSALKLKPGVKVKALLHQTCVPCTWSLRSDSQRIKDEILRRKNESLTSSRIDKAIEDYKRETGWDD